MRKFYLLLALVLLKSSVYSQLGGGVELLNARVHKFEFFNNQVGIAYGQGTMIRTIDGGLTWNFVSLPTASSNETLRTSEILDDDSALIFGDGNSIYRTDDQGATWLPVAIPFNITDACKIQFLNSTAGFFAGKDLNQKILLKTYDGGLTWSKQIMNIGPTYVNNLGIHFISTEIGYTWFDYSFYKTADGGITWLPIANPSDGRIVDIKESESGKLIMRALSSSDSSTKYFISNNGGISWEIIPELTYENGVNPIGFDFTIFGETLTTTGNIPLNYNRHLIKFDLSTGALSSNPILEISNNSESYALAYSDDESIIMSVVHNSPSSDGFRKILRTVDGGITWSIIDAGVKSAYSVDINVLKNDDNRYTMTHLESYNFTLFTSQNNGATWQEKIIELGVSGKLLRASGDYISYIKYIDEFNYGLGHVLCQSNDFGETWLITPINLISFNSVLQFQQFGDNILVDPGSPLKYSADLGLNWIDVAKPTVPNIIFYDNIIYNGGSTFYAKGTYNNYPTEYDYYLYKSVDFGQTWQLVVTIPDNNGVNLGAIASTTVLGETVGLVSTGGNTYFQVDLENNTYTQIPFHNLNPEWVYIPEHFVSYINDSTLISIYNSKINISTNNGIFWAERPCVVCGDKFIYDEESAELLTFSDSYGIERITNYIPLTPGGFGTTDVAVGNSTNYYASYDRYAQPVWELLSGGTLSVNSPATSVSVEWTEVGTHILRVKNVNVNGASEYREFHVTVNGLLDVSNLKIFEFSTAPNPVTSKLTIFLHNFIEPSSTINIYNLAGQLLLSNEATADKVEINNLETLPNNVYLLEVKNSGHKYVRKFIKI